MQRPAFTLCVALALSCGSSARAIPEASQAGLVAQADAAVADLELVGVTMAVHHLDDDSTWVAASGLAEVETMTAWEPERSIRIGSVTKTFTAALIFLLIEEGTIGLDDPIEQWVPGYYQGQGVSLRHLLSNTSGIASYNYVGSFDESVPWLPTQLVQWAVDHEPELLFTPGSQWEYSNTNFVLLGLVIEAATGNTYAQELSSRLLAPLGLDDTYLAESGDQNSTIVDCYDRDGTNTSDSSDPSYGWAAGAAVSTPEDLVLWAAALYGGEVLSGASLELMTTPTELSDGTSIEYGLGAFVEADGEDALVGHSGGFSGYLTYMYYWKADRIALVVATNTFDTDLRDLAGYGWSVPLGFAHPE